ncbi:hypothetical protein L228DRAFT_266286 [Xylona heveae TC161]|uniref:Uncharacterized protein n=1 Tax=Xylona heveae (strain CBS 132557 / TC161) TaxID=1328760 RepID=A0A165J7H7_XYLHT|nr:hypothetical protein L228DRAFT_266286 [Xylona heveae TC161]KZF25848.1 hypothetical protein L228DRAFT_266286 [Xylona heveae TC161]
MTATSGTHHHHFILKLGDTFKKWELFFLAPLSMLKPLEPVLVGLDSPSTMSLETPATQEWGGREDWTMTNTTKQKELNKLQYNTKASQIKVEEVMRKQLGELPTSLHVALELWIAIVSCNIFKNYTWKLEKQKPLAELSTTGDNKKGVSDKETEDNEDDKEDDEEDDKEEDED